MDRDARLAELEADKAALRARVVELNEQIARLVGKIADLEVCLGRDSSNSSKPPSSDVGRRSRPGRRTRTARHGGAMGRKQGKQPGTPGFTLARVTDRGEVVVHPPARCRACAAPLDDAPVVGEVIRQVFDVPDPAVVVVVEHRAQRRRCGCGCATSAAHRRDRPGLLRAFGPKRTPCT